MRDIDYAEHASAGVLKTEASKRDVPLVEDLRSILIAGQSENPSEYIFHGREGKPISTFTRTSAGCIWQMRGNSWMICLRGKVARKLHK